MSSMERVLAIIAVLCVAVTYVLVYLPGASHRRPPGTESQLTTLTVIRTNSTTCRDAAVGLQDNVDADREVCRPLLGGDADNSVLAPPTTTSMTVGDYVQLASTDCGCFRSRLDYFTPADTTPEERAFPIAFSLLTYENLEQTERLLRLVYRPHNLYCIHVDRKSNEEMHRGIEAVAACLPNVMVARPAINVKWGAITVLQAEMLCMGYLLAHSGVQWKYFINLVGRDLPLRTNEELVEILEAYGGANDIHGTRKW